MAVPTEVKKFREVIMHFCIIRLIFRFEQGEFDYLYEDFLKANRLEIHQNVKFQANDIRVMRELLGMENDEGIMQKIHNWWRKGC